MPRLSQAQAPAAQVEFVASVPVDLMTAMFFTSLVEQAEGIDDWPARVRKELDPDLRAELDFLFTFPIGDPGIMGNLADHLMGHPETWKDIDALLKLVADLPAGVGEAPEYLGVQGLALYGRCSPLRVVDRPAEQADPRAALVEALEEAGADVDAALALYDRPEELRARMLDLIKRFYEEHYRQEIPNRMPCLERSVAAHRGKPVEDAAALARQLSGRPVSCLETVCAGPYEKYVFAPSLDLGPYVSCADLPGIHGLVYPCEPEFMGRPGQEGRETVRLARVYKALGDEQRLRILRLLQERELYAQEIVERTGLHQSVVSRHLSFMAAVGLLTARREANMKFYALNPEMGEALRSTLQMFEGAPAG